MALDELARVTGLQAQRLLSEGKITALELTEACLACIAADEPRVQAWAFLDPDLARAQARRCDEARRLGRPQGPLHGIPVGVKDIIDTRDMPTENGTVLHAGRRPTRDAAVVERLRTAGAVILGKTVTTELAVYHPGKTRNPHDPERTPGGSSSGSAAAVAAAMVPLAIGSQTNGSVIRPAGYCGVFAFKPSFGLISRFGVLAQSRSLDHIGVFARTVDDLALIAEPLIGFDARDPDTRLEASPRLLEAVRQDWPLAPDLALVKSPVWDQAEDDLKAGFAELAQALGPRITEVDLPEAFNAAHGLHGLIMSVDLARSFVAEYERGRDQLSERLRGIIEDGRRALAIDYARALEVVPVLRESLDPLFSRYDMIVTPATTGQAPRGLSTTGSPVFCTIWTLLGMPSVTLPLLTGADGMPIGVQLVGRFGDDARVLRAARWLVTTIAGLDAEPAASGGPAHG
jgi:Asp-tRNA(Asn)/Glu-tRNA(Gln) amidotransferase A subunit family amidase